MSGDLFRRQVYAPAVIVRGITRSSLRNVYLEKCSQTSACLSNPKRSRLAGGICPECHGAVLTGEEIAFLRVPRVGRMREPGED
jgi:hypothetical protein